MRNFVFIFIVLCIGLNTGCSPQLLDYKNISPLVLNKSPEYKIDLSTIPKPEPINRKYGILRSDGSITLVNPDMINEADVIVLTLDEYKKIGELVKLAITYKELVLQQEVLINENIKIENSLKEFVELERLKTIEYSEMWINSENMYRQERYDNSRNKIVSNIVQVILSGAVVLLAF